MVNRQREFKKLLSVVHLPHSLRTELRLRIFFEISKQNYFVADSITGFNLRTIRKILKDFINDNLIERRVLMYHISQEGRAVMEQILSSPDLRNFLERQFLETEEEKPEITILK